MTKEESIRRVKLAIDRQQAGETPMEFGAPGAKLQVDCGLVDGTTTTLVACSAGLFSVDELGNVRAVAPKPNQIN